MSLLALKRGIPNPNTPTARCLRVLRNNAELTVGQLSNLTGLSRPTVVTVTDELVKGGLLVEITPDLLAGRTGTGRPPRGYRLNATALLACGVEIGLHYLELAVTDFSGTIRLTKSWPLEATSTADERIAGAGALIRQCFAEHGLSLEAVKSLVIATSGIIDATGKVILSTRLPGWTGTDLAARFTEALACPVKIENNVNMYALAELHLGCAQSATDVLYFYLDQGCSSALIMGGQLYRGAHNAAGEVVWGDSVALPTSRDGEDPRVATRALAQAAAQGQPEALRLIEELSEQLARISVTSIGIIDPDQVLIGGEVIRAGGALTAPLQTELNQRLIGRPVPEVTTAHFLDHGAVLGALAQANLTVSLNYLGIEKLPEAAQLWRFEGESALQDDEFNQ